MLLSVGVGAYTGSFFFYLLFQYRSLALFNNGDFALYNNLFWNSLNLRSPLWEPATRISGFIYHMSPLLLLFVPFYGLYSHAPSLFFLESLALSFGAVPLFVLAKDHLQSKVAAILVSSSYLLFPALQYANLDTFHEVSFAPVFILSAIYFFQKKRHKSFLASTCLLLLIREDIALMVIMFGIYALLLKRGKKWFLPPMAIGTVYFAVVFWVVMPYLSQGAPFFNIGRFAYLVSGPQGILKVAFAPINGSYLVDLFGPVAFTSLLSPVVMLISLPILLENILSAGAGPEHSIYYSHYSTPIIAIIFFAAVFSLRRLQPLAQRAIELLVFSLTYVKLSEPHLRKTALYFLPAAFILLTLSANVFRDGSPLTAVAGGLLDRPQVSSEDAISRIFMEVPTGARVAADFRLLPMLSARHQWEIFWFDGSPSWMASNTTADFVLTDVSHASANNLLYREGLRDLLSRSNWKAMSFERGLLLLLNQDSKFGGTFFDKGYRIAFKIGDKLDFEAGRRFLSFTEWKVHDDHLGLWVFSDPFAKTPDNTIPERPNATISYTFFVPKGVSYFIFANVLWGSDRGTLRYRIDDGPWSTGFQPLSSERAWKHTLLGSSETAGGYHTITFMNTKPYQGAGLQDIQYFFFVDQAEGPVDIEKLILV